MHNAKTPVISNAFKINVCLGTCLTPFSIILVIHCYKLIIPKMYQLKTTHSYCLIVPVSQGSRQGFTASLDLRVSHGLLSRHTLSCGHLMAQMEKDICFQAHVIASRIWFLPGS